MNARKHPVDEVLPLPKLAVYGLQHVLAFYAGAVLVPILVAGGLGLSTEQLIHLINADLFTCGIASIIQSVGIGPKIGVRLPLLQGVTFSAVGPMISIGLAAGSGEQGLTAIYGAVLVGGLFTYLAAPHFARLARYFPPVVTGTVILIIGIGLLPVAANDVVAGRGPHAIQDPVLARNLAYAFGTLGLIVAIQRFAHGFMGTVAVLIGLVAGTLAAWLLGDASFAAVSDADALGYTLPFHYGWPVFSITACLSMCIVMLITMVESTGDVYATGEIVRKRIRREDIARTLRADGLATMLGGALNSFPYTCYAENVGLVRLTQIKSRWVVCAAGVIMLMLGSMPKAAAIVASIPHPVLGGAALAMFAAVAVVGIQTLAKVDFSDHRNLVIVSTSLGLAVLITAQPYVAAALPEWSRIVFGSGITLGAMAAILLNVLFHHLGPQDAVLAGSPDRGRVTLEQVNAMAPSSFAATFGALVENVPWVLERAWAQRPFADARALRAAFGEALMAGDTGQQVELLNAYADLGSEGDADNAYVLDHDAAGMSILGEDAHTQVRALAQAYRSHFGFPLVVCARDVERYERILANGWQRLSNPAAMERAAGVVEAARIANYRFNDLVANANPIDAAREIRFVPAA